MKEYATTDIVPSTAEYLCTSCGEITEFEAEDDFAVCGSCGDDSASWTPAVEEIEASSPAEEPEEESAE
jgi:hypothetical protein